MRQSDHKRRLMGSALTPPLFEQLSFSSLVSPPQKSIEGSISANPYLARISNFGAETLACGKFTHASLFCGGGGLDLGLGFAGFRTVVANDIAPAFVKSVTSNIPNAVGLVKDVFCLSKKELLDAARREDIDLVSAGPPCQAFSILGMRGALDDPRGKLTLKYFDLISKIRPKAFLFENVPGILSVNSGEDWQRLLQFVKEVTGYQIYWTKLNAVDFGIPQFRERVFVVGFASPVPFEFPSLPTGPGAQELVIAGNLKTPSSWALEFVEDLPNQRIRPHGSRVKGRYAQVSQGSRDATDHTDRIHPDYPSGTVLVGSAAGGGRPHIHPTENRVLTVREAARLQSFPDWFIFHGTTTAQYRQVGNAVPPLLAYEVGKAVVSALSKTTERN